MNDEIKTLIRKENWLYQIQRRSGNLDYTVLKAITADVSNAMNSSKSKYNDCLAKNLMPACTKTHWPILKKY